MVDGIGFLSGSVSRRTLAWCDQEQPQRNVKRTSNAVGDESAATRRRPTVPSPTPVIARCCTPRRVCWPYIADMADILLGVLAIVAGLAMLVAGRFVLRLMLPIWGFFAGFAFGAGLIADITDERFLATALGWVLGLLFALIFAVLAYLYYYVAIVLVMAAFGFAIGSGLVVALGIDWSWVAVLVGLVVGIALGLLSMIVNMPMIVLVVVGSFAGAVGVVGGLMLLVGELNSSDFSRGDFTDTVSNSWVWSLLLVVLAIAGILIQAAQRALLRSSIQDTWYAEPM
jgi:hypothetical protein